MGKYFVCEIAGIPNFAEPLLNNPGSYRGRDQALKTFATAANADHLVLLSTEQLKDIAVALEDETDRGTLPFHHEVGGDKQIAVLANGSIKEFQSVSPDPTSETRPQIGLTLLTDVGFNGFVTNELDSSPETRTIAIDGHFSHFRQVIDGGYFGHSEFEGMQIIYNGTLSPFFGPDNTFVDCVLVLGPTVDSTRSGVQKMAKSFQWKRIVRSKQILGTGPLLPMSQPVM